MTDQDIIENLKFNKYSLVLKGLYKCFPEAKKYILSNNGSEEDAQDIFQDALVILYKKVHSNTLTLTSSLKNYLFAIVKNCWLQELRRRNKNFTGNSEEKIPADEFNEEAMFSSASAAFNLLGEKCKMLLILFYHRKQSYKEIATALSFSDEKTAKNQKYRCLQKAKENYSVIRQTNNHE
jgi:RNA polymerase sigma factor (sigma-70 family)